jgi:hypothetical protein
MRIDRRELRERIEKLSDEDLVRMLSDDPEQYRPDVLSWAKEQAARRNLAVEYAASTDKAEETVVDGLPEAGEAGIGAAVDATESGNYYAAGKKIICPHCQHDRFESKVVLLNTRGLTFFNLDWMNAAATALLCSNCGLIQWFGVSPDPSAGESQE